MFVDTHCHLTAEGFDEDRGEVLERAHQAGLSVMVSIASGLEDSRGMSEFVSGDSSLRGTVGIHPHKATEATTAALAELDRLATAPGIVAIGETGLDYHYDFSPRAQQLVSLGAHLSLAVRHDLPLVVHSRSAVDDTMAFLDEARGEARGVLHCFSGPRELLERALDIGWMLSFTGIVTFKSFEAEMLARVPSDRYMLETDSPYLAPIPHRGKRNEPSFLPHIAEAVAAIRGCSVDDVAKETTRNASTFFRLDEDPSGT